MALSSRWLIASLAGATTVAAVPAAIAVAHRTDIIDKPGPLKPQEQPVPYLGGLAVGCGLAVAAAAGGHLRLIAPPVAAMVLGLADDSFDLPVAARLAAEVAVGLGVASVTDGPGQPFSGAGATLATVVLINAVNVIDGLDGLASGVVGVGMGGFSVLLAGPERRFAAAIGGALAGFLWFNRPPARIYLGDAGSYLLGAAAAELLAASWRRPNGASFATLLLVAYPGAELACSVIRRRRGGRPLLEGDRDHTYDRLRRAGRSVAATSTLCAAGQAALAGVAVGVAHLGARRAALAVGGVALALLGAAAGTGLLDP